MAEIMRRFDMISTFREGQKLEPGFYNFNAGLRAFLPITINSRQSVTLHVDQQSTRYESHADFFTDLVDGWEWGAGNVFPTKDEHIESVTVNPYEGATVVGIRVFDRRNDCYHERRIEYESGQFVVHQSTQHIRRG